MLQNFLVEYRNTKSCSSEIVIEKYMFTEGYSDIESYLMAAGNDINCCGNIYNRNMYIRLKSLELRDSLRLSLMYHDMHIF